MHFSTAASKLYFIRAVCSAVSLRVGTQFPLTLLALPELSLLVFKVLGVKSH